MVVLDTKLVTLLLVAEEVLEVLEEMPLIILITVLTQVLAVQDYHTILQDHQ